MLGLILLLLLSGQCPEGMVYMTAAECQAHGSACPRLCLDMTSTNVQCAATCYNGCYCDQGFYLLNGSCVPLAQCSCYYQGELYPAGATLVFDACNNWYCYKTIHKCSVCWIHTISKINRTSFLHCL